MRLLRSVALCAMLIISIVAKAQIGEYRSELAVGPSAGYVMSNVGFNPTIPQKMLGGLTGGVTVRYTCEKYFKSICALVGEVNIAQIGWKEDIINIDNQPVINKVTELPEEFSRKMTYVQVPLMARLGWGRERNGMQFFFQAGPQFGFYLSDKTESNFDYSQRNTSDRTGALVDAPQDTMAVENKFDYGITAGLGMEYSHPKIGHIMLEGRYYYGLGDMFGNSKQDFFGRSNFGNIVIKMTYLFDIIRTKNSKIK